MNYKRKLANPKWQRKRLEIFERDNWACVKCGQTERELQVHHIKYLQGKEPHEHPNELLETLCANCHHSETVIQVLSKMPIDIEDWKKLEFSFRNTEVPLKKFIHFIWEASKDNGNYQSSDSSDGCIETFRIGWRNERLYALSHFLGNEIRTKILCLYDHEGCLSVVWKKNPTDSELKIVIDTWDKKLGETESEHHMNDILNPPFHTKN